MKTVLIAASAALALASGPAGAADLGDEFLDALSALCGQKYEAKVTKSNESDQTWRDSRIVMHVRDCSENEVKIPLAVGEDTSRTWIFRKEEGSLELKHDHRHADGTPDEITMYGGQASRIVKLGQNGRLIVEFPADEYSKSLFQAHGLEASVENVWVLMVEPGNALAYRLQRPGRVFQIDFDLTRPVGE